MKIIKKIYIYFLVVTCIAVLIRCDNFDLDIAPVSSTTDGSYWRSPQHWDAFSGGIHHRMRGNHSGFTILFLGEWRADLWATGAGGNNVYEYISQNEMTEDRSGLSSYAGYYTTINQINLLIDNSLETDVISENERNFYLGQGYGLRAYYYYHLLRSWGDVIVNTEPSYGFDIAELERPQDPASAVMAQIKSDIDNSIKHFPDYSFRKGKGHWSKAATLMLKADVYLWSSRHFGGGDADATTAKNALEDIQLNIPSLGLESNFRDVFNWQNKENDEIIFAIKFERDESMWNRNSFAPDGTELVRDQHLYFDSLTGGTFDYETHVFGSGFSPYGIYNRIYNTFSNEDSRRYHTLQAVWVKENGEYVQRYDANWKPAGTWLKKFEGGWIDGARYWVDDFPVYRYAELLLFLAEAKAILGEDPSNEINLVRERAFGANYQVGVHDFGNQEIDNDVFEALLRERKFEFIGEGRRWYDLRRFGTEYVVKYTSANANRLLWPIDLGTLTRNPALKQTPGY